MQSMAGLWGKVWGRTPPPGVLGSVLISELRPRNPQAGRAGQGGHVPGGRAVWHLPSPVLWIRFCPTVLVASSGLPCSLGPLEGPEDGD